MKTTALSFFFSVLAIAGCLSDPCDPAFHSVDEQMGKLGLSLTFDLVDGGYTVYANEADDETMIEAVKHLKKLRQGKSLTELDYERRFSFFLGRTAISDKAISEILTLEVTQVRLYDTKVTSRSLNILEDAPYLRVLVVGSEQFSQKQLDDFVAARPDVVLMKSD